MFIVCMCVVLVRVCQSLPLAGWIQSPEFPHGYGPNEAQTWNRCAPPGYALILTVLHLDLEESYDCENDALTISEDHVVLSTLCGRKTPEELQLYVNPLLRSSSGGCLSLTFHSDYSNIKRHTGFKLFYTTQDVDECWENDIMCSHFCHNYIGRYSCSCKPGYYLDTDQHTCRANCTEEHHGVGILTPPGSPGPYFENADCVFTLTVDEGNQLELKFTGVFDVESRDGQCIDFIKVTTDTQNFGPFCGNVRPGNILTSSQKAQVTFHSDPEGENKGFSLKYSPKGMECPGNVTPYSTLSPAKNLYMVSETVTVRCRTGYVLNDLSKTFQSTCQINGKWSPNKTCEIVDCGIPELPDLVKLTEEHAKTTYANTVSVECSSEFYDLVGNAEFNCSASGDWVAENGQNLKDHPPQCVPVCGITKESASERIFGGKAAKLGQIPWQLLVREPRGGASLINDRWAITAAHVVENRKTLIFNGGMIDGQDQNRVEMEMEKIIIYPEYNKGNNENYNHDIALVKMSSRVPLSENLRPVCLPKKKSSGLVLEGKMGTVSGFGKISDKAISRFLQYGHVKEYTDDCFETDKEPSENMFCAGDADGQVDSCKGDSGGPLIIPMLGFGSEETPYTLKGLVSWGPPECGNKNYRGYYTKVENYLDWIKDVMEKN